MRKGQLPDRPSSGAQTTNNACTCESGGFDHACRRCQQPICKACLSTAHSLHETGTIRAVADELKVEVGAILSDRVRRARKDEVTDVKNRVANLKKELHKLETEQIDSINEHIQELKQALETMRVDLVSRVSHIVKQETDSLNKMERILKRTEQTLTRIYDDTVRLLTKANNVEVVSKAYDLKEEIGEILGTDLSLPSRGAAYDAKFVAGTIDFDILREMCGEIVMPAVTGLGAVGRSGDHAAKTISKPAGTGMEAIGGSGAHITKKMPQYGDGQDGQGAAANSGPSKTKISGQMSPTRTHKFSVTAVNSGHGIPVYTIVDNDGEPIKGTFYASELQKVSKERDELFKVKRVLKRRNRKAFLRLTSNNPKSLTVGLK
ncbi:hypothetical protein ScPMuIL_007312 [Solemya velum]